jgi:hypothetical protein
MIRSLIAIAAMLFCISCASDDFEAATYRATGAAIQATESSLEIDPAVFIVQTETTAEATNYYRAASWFYQIRKATPMFIA